MFIMLGYAPKKMCRPVSIQSPSASCHAETFPPRTFRASYTVGWCPASVRYFAHDRPERPPPIMATFFFSPSFFTFRPKSAQAGSYEMNGKLIMFARSVERGSKGKGKDGKGKDFGKGFDKGKGKPGKDFGKGFDKGK